MSKLNYKFILLGNSAVGKTSIFRKISTGQFNDKMIATIGVDKRTIETSIDVKVNNQVTKKDCVISLYDTSGQEQFRSVTLSYYRGSDGILLIYDITNRESFDNVEKWMDSIKDSIENKSESKYAIILLGNKSDLIDVDGFKREVTENEAMNTCDKLNMIWGGEISTKNITKEELNELFKKYIKDIYKQVGEKKTGKQNEKKLKVKKKKSGGLFSCLL